MAAAAVQAARLKLLPRVLRVQPRLFVSTVQVVHPLPFHRRVQVEELHFIIKQILTEAFQIYYRLTEDEQR